MKILLSNDDGYLAPGLRILAAELSDLAEITVVAPERNCSGASHSLTLEYPIRAELADNGFIRVDGTPTDCVHLAITGLLDEEPAMVLAAIHAGANLGHDVLSSGSVAGPPEGRFLGLPAIALSMNGHDPKYYETGARVARELVEHLQAEPLAPDTIINVNIPDLPYDQLKGYQVTRLGHRHRAEPVVRDTDPRGRTIYWVGPAGLEQDAGSGTDFFAVREGYVSVTPLQVDLTRYADIDRLGDWLGRLGQ